MIWRLAAVVLLLSAVLAALAVFACGRDMAKRRAALASGADIAETRLGPIEFARRGDGPPVLVIHGAGGGYDQGLLLATALGGEGLQSIAPSRFGYLRSPLQANASTAAQADLFAALLDSLGIERAGVLAMSGGVPPALQLAERHPERVSALVLISSAPFAPFGASSQDLPVPIAVYNALFGSDFPYWLLRRIAPHTIEPMFDIRPDLLDSVTAEERFFAREMMAGFEPVTARMKGLRNEGAAVDPAARYDLGAIGAPTLIVHADDDRLNPVAIAEALRRGIARAELRRLPRGGHLLLGSHDVVRAEANAFLKKAAQSPEPLREE